MSFSKKTIQLYLGLALICAGGLGSVVMFLQPWRSCPEIDDSYAGCPATSHDSTLLGFALAVFVAGIVLLTVSSRPVKVSSDEIGPFGKLD